MRNRKKDLEKSRKIFNQIQKEGVFDNMMIIEGYKLTFPDKDVPYALQARIEFMSFHHHLYHDVYNNLKDEKPKIVKVNTNKKEIDNEVDSTKKVVTKTQTKKRGRKPKTENNND